MADRPSVGRIGNHYLNGIKHLEWVAKNDNDYIEKSILLASDLFKLKKIRNSLRSEIENSYVKNPKRFTAQLEKHIKKCGIIIVKKKSNLNILNSPKVHWFMI